ncbi:MAG TPA: hypothetical protein VFY73_14325 [Ideonella sp.]|jgi:hypothetical protein|nr:hypothetical protein [Ideonella sp.]HEX5685195.1 hypothetical protein [Ideonella sp.]
MNPDRCRPWLRRAALAGAGLLLALVFMAYQSPHTVVDLANRVWACF